MDWWIKQNEDHEILLRHHLQIKTHYLLKFEIICHE